MKDDINCTARSVVESHKRGLACGAQWNVLRRHYHEVLTGRPIWQHRLAASSSRGPYTRCVRLGVTITATTLFKSDRSFRHGTEWRGKGSSPASVGVFHKLRNTVLADFRPPTLITSRDVNVLPETVATPHLLVAAEVATALLVRQVTSRHVTSGLPCDQTMP